MHPSPVAQREPELPLQTPSVASLTLAAVIAVIAWIAILAQADLTIDRTLARGLTVFDALARMSSYLTNLTVLACALCFTSIALWKHGSPLARFFRRPTAVTAVVAYMVFVGIAYHLLLRGLWPLSPYRRLLNESLHSLLPTLAALYWMLFVPRFHLRLRHCLLWLVYPLTYLGVTFWRGTLSDFYPYPFINVEVLGLRQVLVNSALLFGGFLMLLAVFAGINFRRRR
ncbi:Pr6Pr family membrane protein [Paraburkholderia sp. MMS20-SJTN17]|uniref:Pr6Pr family membrane protein n=1 Tax=Paraburkholderia translucens TaxID=2886945 RepID=A0ABS8KGQ7_9BURK|nr:Pr6Pr family membrane protein [Paraburkholderia sp. MMS20-SJTN17]MCC8403971.1 Pr6Pr family membrane protein [Paraburkholderia sp. MMS20-SJTN17]